MSNRGETKLPKQEIIEKEETKTFLSNYFSPPINQNMISSSSSRKRDKNQDDDHQPSIDDRDRRAKMTHNFSVLQSMVPTLWNWKPSKPPQEAIITETTKYIKYLEQETKRLEALKRCNQFKESKSILTKFTNHNSCKKVAVSNDATFLAIQLPVKLGLIPEIVKVLEKNRAEVLESRFCVDDNGVLTFTSTLMLNGGSTIDKIKDELTRL